MHLQGGAYKGLVDVLASVSFTFASDDTELAWAIAQVRKDIRAGVKAVPCYIDTELNATARHGSKLRPGSSQRAGLGSTACVGSITQEFGKRVGWFPVSTARVLAGMHKVTGASPAAQGTGGAGGSLPDRAALLQALGSEEALGESRSETLTPQALMHLCHISPPTMCTGEKTLCAFVCNIDPTCVVVFVCARTLQRKRRRVCWQGSGHRNALSSAHYPVERSHSQTHGETCGVVSSSG